MSGRFGKYGDFKRRTKFRRGLPPQKIKSVKHKRINRSLKRHRHAISHVKHQSK